jgi:Fe-Mn family superoxide dismutase
MAEEHVLKKLPFAYNALNGISEQTVKFHHDTHHAGYVNKLDEIEKKLEAIERGQANANYSEYGELKRRETFNASGVILHDIYWEILGGNGEIDEGLSITKKIKQDFGSVEKWKEDLMACAKASTGWAILCWDASDGKLKNFLCDSHNIGAVWGAVPLIALDVFEHAYYHDYGPNRAAYFWAFFKNLNWKAVDERYKKYVLK